MQGYPNDAILSTIRMTSFDFTTVLLMTAVVSLAAATTLALLLRRRPALSTVLFAALGIAFAALAGSVVLDLAGPDRLTVVTESTRALSLVAATHRRLLVLLPLLLTGTSLIVLGIYRERVAEKHAREYRDVLILSAGVSLITSILIAVESAV